MCKWFRKIFNLAKAEDVEQLKQIVVYKDGCIATLTKQRDYFAEELESLKKKVEDSSKCDWVSVKDIKKDQYYYVVTQGGYYSIKGNRILFGVMSGVTRRAVRNGFVVRTEKEADALQKVLFKLVK